MRSVFIPMVFIRNAIIATILTILWPVTGGADVTLFQEPFEDTNFASRGWYDTTGGGLSTTVKYAGTRSLECHFLVGGMTCNGGNPGRRLFTETDSVYLSYYIKHSTNWVGSGQAYHPHMFYFLTNQDGAYSGLAYTHLTSYVEEVGGVPTFIIQDGVNIDETRIGVDLTNVTEQRAVAGCNGDSDGYGNGTCYVAGRAHWNGKSWTPGGQVYFNSTPGSPYYKGDWHHVEVYFKLNSLVGGKGAKDGIIRYWYDGTPIMNHSNVVFRTGSNPTMKFNQLVISPWIGDGSPADQTYWIDNLTIATAPLVTPVSGGADPPPLPKKPNPPVNIQLR